MGRFGATVRVYDLQYGPAKPRSDLNYKNLPNQLTVLRLVLAAAFFVVLNQYRYQGPEGDPQTVILWISIGLFVLAAFTDYLDGYLARRWGVESQFGRIMDPFCDKVLVIGALIYLAGPRFVMPEHVLDQRVNMVSGVYPWMVALILARELLVTGIRGELEAMGVRFGASIWGKVKMILQSIVCPLVLLLVWLDPIQNVWVAYFRDIVVYATVLVSVISGLPYVLHARGAMKKVND